ncbi:MAG: glycosyltransferase family 2 protein [Bacteroidales bacterium]
MGAPDLSICIVSYNTRDLLSDCLSSLYAAGLRASFEVIVVDNGSGDGSVEMLRQAYPQVRVVENHSNMGYTRPNNQALKLASGNYAVLLNPDTYVCPGAFDTLIGYMDAHPEVGVCTPKVLNRTGTLQKQCRRSAARPWDVVTYFTGLSRLFPKSPLFARYLKTYLDENQTSEVEAVSGSCMLIRRVVIEQIGYLDEAFFAYQEDADYSFRVRQAGWKIHYVPGAQIVHYGGHGGSQVQVYQSIYHWHRSYFLYYNKHLAREYFFLVNWAMYGLMSAKFLLAIVSAALRKDKVAGTRKP